MALPGTRQSTIFEDPEFNLGMNADAFANLGLDDLIVAQDQNLATLLSDAQQKQDSAAGIMGLPNANTTVANPAVAQAVQQTVAPTDNLTRAKDLFEKYATGFDPGQQGYDFWAQQYAKEGATPESVIQQFLSPTDTAAPRTFYMQSDPDYIAAKKASLPKVDTSGFEKFEGKPYDPNAYKTVRDQLAAQQKVLTSQFKVPYQSTFGDVDQTLDDMAKRLAAMGISDIREFGMRHELPVEKVYETIPQDEGPSLTVDTGKYRTISGIKGKGSEGETIYDYRELTPDEVKRLQFRDDSGVGFLPIERQDTKNLYNTPFATTTYYNKKTGQVLDTKAFGGKDEAGLFASSGAGRGYTDYRVMFDKSGTPIFVPQKEKSGMDAFVAKDLPGILSVLRFVPGAAPFVMAAQVAGALHQGAKPGDIAKQVIPSLIASNLGKIVGAGMDKFNISAPTTEVGKLAMQGGLGALSSLIQGGSLEDALKSGALSAAGSGISSLLPESKDFDYAKIIRAVAPAIASGKLTNADVFRLMSSLAAPTKTKPPGKP